MVWPSTGGTRKPERPSKALEPVTSDRRKAMVTRAIDAYSTPASSAEAAGDSAASRVEADQAGAARTMPSAVITRVSVRTSQPSAPRVRPSTGVSVRISPPPARTASATAPGRVPRPPSIPWKTGPVCCRAAACSWMRVTPSSREPARRATSKSWGTAARIEIR